MGFFSGLFGGSEGSPSKVVDVTPKQFEGLRDPVANLLQQFLTGSTPPSTAGVPSPTGPTTAPLQPVEQQILQLIGGQATGGGGLGGAKALTNKTLAGDFLSPSSNPFLQQTIEAATRPVFQAFEEQIMPHLRSTFTRAGHTIQGEGSSPFAREQNRAFRDLETSVGDIGSKIAFQNFSQERERQQQAVGQSLSLSSGELDNMVKSLQASALPRLIEQLGIDKGIQQFNTRINTLLQALQMALAASSPQTAVLPGTSGSPDTTGDILGGLGSLGLGAAALFGKDGVLSDARLKTDIHKVGKLDSGPSVYTYRFKGSDTPQIGVMAQEVEQLIPAAVGDIGGIKFVRTDKL